MGETPGTFWGLAVLASDKNSVVCGGGVGASASAISPYGLMYSRLSSFLTGFACVSGSCQEGWVEMLPFGTSRIHVGYVRISENRCCIIVYY